MSAQDVRSRREQEAHERAAEWLRDHVVTVEHEHGLYRHYRCAKPGTVNMSFHVVTFPGRLIVCGDIGDTIWERSPDMLKWAAGAVRDINYFAGKVWPHLKTEEWCEEVARECVIQEYADKLAYWDGDTSAEADKRRRALAETRDELLSAAGDSEHRFTEAYHGSDWYGGDMPNVQTYTHEFLRCREAVRWFLPRWHEMQAKAATTAKEG